MLLALQSSQDHDAEGDDGEGAYDNCTRSVPADGHDRGVARTAIPGGVAR